MKNASIGGLLMLAASAACAGGADVPLAVGGGYENWRLPGNERLGVVHAQVLFEAAPQWWVGPAVYGAASGQRGGLYIGGLALQRPWALTPSLSLVPGLAVGGGGGAAAPVGNGLMLRPSLSLQMPLADWRAGIGVSRVSFPGSPIASTQWGLVAEWRGQFVAEPLARLGERRVASGRSGLGFDRMALSASRYTLGGGAPSPHVPLVGVRLDRMMDGSGDAWSGAWGVEAAAAANAASAGYMEILGHAGAEWPIGPAVRLGARAALGFGGGGAVPTGGGTIGHLDATLRVDPAPGWHLGASLGRVGGASSSMRGTRVEFSLATDLEPLQSPGSRAPAGTVRRVEWAGTVQQLRSVRRGDGSKQSLQTMGLQLNGWLTENAYLSGQAHSAFGGDAGAYSQGLLGLGVSTPMRGRYLQVGVEALAGGAGGGGVQSLAGAIVQGTLWAGFQPERDGPHLRVGVGAEKSRGGTASPVLSVGWVVPFAQVTR